MAKWPVLYWYALACYPPLARSRGITNDTEPRFDFLSALFLKVKETRSKQIFKFPFPSSVWSYCMCDAVEQRNTLRIRIQSAVRDNTITS